MLVVSDSLALRTGVLAACPTGRLLLGPVARSRFEHVAYNGQRDEVTTYLVSCTKAKKLVFSAILKSSCFFDEPSCSLPKLCPGFFGSTPAAGSQHKAPTAGGYSRYLF